MQTLDAGKRKYASVMPIILSFLSALGLSFSLFVTAAYFVLYLNPGYFEREYEKYDVMSSMPVEMTMSEEDGVMAVTDHTMDFLLHGEHAEDLQIEVMMDGKTQPFFSERTLTHMMDVRDIFMISIRFFAFGIIMAITLNVFSRIILCHDEPKIYRFSTGIGVTAGAAIVIAGFACAAAAVFTGDFSAAFISFHEQMFDNDFWLLNPAEDYLINLLPEGFFMDTAFRIAVVFAILEVLLLTAGIIIIRSSKKMPDYQYTDF